MAGNVHIADHRTWVTATISNPGQRNALTPAMLIELRHTLDDPAHRPELRVVLLRGAEGAFSSGFALDRVPAPDDLAPEDDIERLCRTVESSPFAVAAVIDGVCIGAGLDLACACDIRFAARDARLGITAARLGLVYSWQGIDRIRRTVGRESARWLLLTGELVRADSPIGQRVAAVLADDAADLDAAVHQFVTAVLANAPLSIAGTRRTLALLDQRDRLDEDAAARVHRWRQAALGSKDCREARRAFAEGRAPRFTGR